MDRFIAELAAGRTVRDAANSAGVPRRTAYDIRQRDEDFALAWHDAIEEGTDVYEEEARRRAIDGVPRPLMYQGEKVGEIREYSDRLLELMLKARRPGIYRERWAIEHSGEIKRPTAAEMAEARAAGADPEWEEAMARVAARRGSGRRTPTNWIVTRCPWPPGWHQVVRRRIHRP